jgi:hypothetical protein
MANNTSGYTSKPSDNVGMTSNKSTKSTTSMGMDSSNPIDNVQDAIGQVINQVFRSLEPRIQEFANTFSQRAVDVSEQSVRQLVTRARQKPAYTIGAIALLVVGLGIVLGTTTSASSSNLASHDLH